MPAPRSGPSRHGILAGNAQDLIRHEDAIGSAQAKETRCEGASGPEQCR
jgi:hypothetical protein